MLLGTSLEKYSVQCNQKLLGFALFDIFRGISRSVKMNDNIYHNWSSKETWRSRQITYFFQRLCYYCQHANAAYIPIIGYLIASAMKKTMNSMLHSRKRSHSLQVTTQNTWYTLRWQVEDIHRPCTQAAPVAQFSLLPPAQVVQLIADAIHRFKT